MRETQGKRGQKERMSEDHLTERQQQAQARRNQIIEAAVQLFARQGFDGTSTRQIAQSIGITEGLIFHYFPTKIDLLNAVLGTHHAFPSELHTILAEAADRPAREVLQLLADRWLEILKREEAISLVFSSTAQTNPRAGMALQRVVDEAKRHFAAYLRNRIQAGELRVDLPLETSAHMFFASLITFFLIYHSLPEAQWQERARSFASELVAAWLQGARAIS